MRLGRLIGDVGVRKDVRAGVDRRRQRGRGFEDHCIFGARQRHLEPVAPAPETQRAAPTRIGTRAGNFLQRFVQFLHNLGLRSVAIVPVGELGGHPHAVGIVATDDGEGALDLAAVKIGLEHPFDLVQLAIHEIDAHPVGPGRIHGDDAAILVGHQFVVELRIEKPRGHGEQDRDDPGKPGTIEAFGQQLRVPFGHLSAPPGEASA